MVERWNPYARIRQDLFGILDILGISGVAGGGFVGVQTTTASNVAARRTKIRASLAARAWLLAGGRIEIHGWRKVKNRWACNVEGVTLESL